MKKLILLCYSLLAIGACQLLGKPQYTEITLPIITGAEQVDVYLPLLKDKKVALVVNQTSVIGKTHLVDSLKSRGINIVKVFAPEHGFRGDHSDGADIVSGLDKKTGLMVQSLYGSAKKPSPEMLKNIDIVIFDIQDVGVRFYTYISTMHYVMEACAELGKKVLILDRPNPNGFYIDGPILDTACASFVGMHAIPLVHGLTVAELALMINGEKWLKNGIQCDVEIVSCRHYKHDDLYQLPIAPSPNLPNMNAVYLYPFLGLFEGTNISVGRGTDSPFQILGCPGFKGMLFFTPRSIPGVSDSPKYLGELCSGIKIMDAIDSSIFSKKYLNLDYILLFYQSHDADKGDFFRDYFYKLSGNKTLKMQIEQGFTAKEIRESWEPELEQYKEIRKKYLLYP